MNHRIAVAGAIALAALVVCLDAAWGDNDAQGAALPERALCRLGGRRALHADDPYQHAFSPDAKHLVAGQRDGRLIVWDAVTQARVGEVKLEKPDIVSSIAYAPDGKKLYARTSSALHVVGTADWKVLARDDARGGSGAIAVSPDGARLALGARDGKVVLLDAEKRADAVTIDTGEYAEASFIAFSPDGKLVVSRHGDRFALLDATANKLAANLTKKARDTTSSPFAAFAPDGKSIAVKGYSGLEFLDASTGESARKVKLKGDPEDLVLSPDGKHLLVREYAGLKLIALADGKPVWTYPRQGLDCRFSADGQRLAVRDGKILRVLDAADGRDALAIDGHTQGVRGVSFTSDGARLVSSDADDETCFWDAASGKLVSRAAGRSEGISKVVASLDGLILFRPRTESKKPHELEDAAGKAIRPLEGAKGFVECAAFSPDGKRLAIGGDRDRVTAIWDVESGKKLVDLDHPKERISAIGFAPDGQRVFTVRSPRIEIFEVATGKRATPKEYLDYGSDPVSVAFTPDGKTVAWVTPFGEVKAKVVASGEQVLATKLSALCVAFSPDGKHLAVGQGGQMLERKPGKIRILSFPQGEKVLDLAGHEESVRALAFSPDGKKLASGSEDTTVLVWKVD
ncbi:MAG: PQQ-binding-like beta-propeller repeat protein [Planctomycetota bacterium]